MTEVHWLPAWRLHELMTAGELSPVELVEATVQRAETLDRVYSMFITICADRALADACLSQERYAKGAPLGPLDGIPVSLKDNLWTQGIRTTNGSLVFKDFVPDRDSTIAARLRAAGAVIFGKANLPEFSLFRRSINLLTDETLNPWDLARTSGGSSGGSAVAVTAGVGPISIGSDGGGSIRIPSSFNGVFGLLPSRGRVSVGAEFCHSARSGVGPITRDVRDACLVLNVLAQPDVTNPWSLTTTPPDYEQHAGDGVAGLRMAWSGDFGRIQPHDARVVQVAYEAARAFADLGATIDEPDLHIEDPFDVLELNPRYSNDLAFKEFEGRPDYFSELDFLDRLRANPAAWKLVTPYVRDRTLPPTTLQYSLTIPPAVRRRPLDHFDDIFKRYDVLMSPVISRTAFDVTEPVVTPPIYTEYAYIVNCAGYTAVSVPAGFVDGLPVGLQLIGPPEGEATLLRAARALEQARPWSGHHPSPPS